MFDKFKKFAARLKFCEKYQVKLTFLMYFEMLKIQITVAFARHAAQEKFAFSIPPRYKVAGKQPHAVNIHLLLNLTAILFRPCSVSSYCLKAVKLVMGLNSLLAYTMSQRRMNLC